MWFMVGIGFCLALVGGMAFICFRFSDPCPKCGSRLKDGTLYGSDGQVADPICGNCGHRWCPAWLRQMRDNEE